MKRLIVNADDFGLTEGVNRGILEAHRNGIVTSTTLLVTGAAFSSAVALARHTPALGVGIHLNLTEGQPVLEAHEIPSLVKNGSFRRGLAQFSKDVVTGKVKLQEVEAELRAQIEKAFAAAIQPAHLDGHKHVHMLPGVFGIVVRLAREYGMAGVRCSGEPAAGAAELVGKTAGQSAKMLARYVAGRGLSVLSRRFQEKLRQGGLACPEYFFGITHTGFLDRESLLRILRRLPEGTSELMCHPGYVDAELGRLPTRLREQRHRELEALTQPEVKAFVAEHGIELIRYKDLVATA